MAESLPCLLEIITMLLIGFPPIQNKKFGKKKKKCGCLSEGSSQGEPALMPWPDVPWGQLVTQVEGGLWGWNNGLRFTV